MLWRRRPARRRLARRGKPATQHHRRPPAYFTTHAPLRALPNRNRSVAPNPPRELDWPSTSLPTRTGGKEERVPIAPAHMQSTKP